MGVGLGTWMEGVSIKVMVTVRVKVTMGTWPWIGMGLGPDHGWRWDGTGDMYGMEQGWARLTISYI